MNFEKEKYQGLSLDNEKASLSFEVFPPGTQATLDSLYKALHEMEDLRPDFISVTCSNKNYSLEDSTVKIAEHIQSQHELPSIIHLTAAYVGKKEVDETLALLHKKGIKNILALRGDLYPEIPRNGDFQYAADLITYIKNWDKTFCVTAACYPEGHPESLSTLEDIHHLKE